MLKFLLSGNDLTLWEDGGLDNTVHELLIPLFVTRLKLGDWYAVGADTDGILPVDGVRKWYIALMARLNEQNQTILALQATSSSKKKGPPNKNKDGTNETQEKKKGKKEYKIAAWKKERPARGKGTLERNGKTFHWC